MTKHFFQRGIGYVNRNIKRFTPDKYYSIDDVIKKINHFNIKKLAILVDESTKHTLLQTVVEALDGVEIIGYFSFNLDVIKTQINGFEVKPLPNRGVGTSIDGWLVSVKNFLETYSLSEYIFEQKTEGQVIIQHIQHPQATTYYSYVDFFKNDQQTVVYVHNYFHRLYRIPFPLDIRYTLRDLKGNVHSTGQVIIPPSGIKVFRSEDFAVRDFVGYLEIEFDTNKKVNPFLHYMVDYISDDFISSNHQSGLGLHSANSRFTRGYIPTEKDDTLEVCLFQRNYSSPIVIKGIVCYFENGIEKSVERFFPPLMKNEMAYHDIKALFSDIDFSKVDSPYIEVQSELSVHRPNYYYSRKNKKGYYDTSHAGPDLSFYTKRAFAGEPAITKEETKKMTELGCYGFDLRHVIFPQDMRIDSLLALGNDTTMPIKDFTLDFYTQDGVLVYTKDIHFDYDKERFFDMSVLLREMDIHDFSGSVSIRSSDTATSVPILLNGISGFRAQNNPYTTSTAANGSPPNNIPFYFRGGPPNYLLGSSAKGITDIYARGVLDDVFDTIFSILYIVSDKNLDNTIMYEIEISDSNGHKRILQKSIRANGTSFLRLSDLLEEVGWQSQNGAYAVWFFSSQANLYGQHLLIRKSDGAISVEHCYPGKYGF